MNPLYPESPNALGLAGVEFIEFVTPRPHALGGVLQLLGFVPVARHRSREVVLYRQGTMNLIVNAEPQGGQAEATYLSAVAFRVRDAAFAMRHALAAGAWEVPRRASAMELNIPGILGGGDSAIFFVDRFSDFSIYDVDFVPLPGANAATETAGEAQAALDLHFFGVVQAIGAFRSAEWVDFYQQILGFRVLPATRFSGILPKGTLLESPCGGFHLQLVEPPGGAEEDVHWQEGFARIGFGTPDVLKSTQQLRQRGLAFLDDTLLQPDERGALSQVYLESVTFELVRDPVAPQA